jgi:hypothetical protein
MPNLWIWMPICFVLTVAIELPCLAWGLSARHAWKVRLFSAIWLTACTFPMVWLVIPPLFEGALTPQSPPWDVLTAEVFAASAECLIFYRAFIWGRYPTAGRCPTVIDFATIVLANILSFGCGEWLRAAEVLP